MQPRRWFEKEDITSYHTSLLCGNPKKKKPDPGLFNLWWHLPFSKKAEKYLDQCHSSWTCTKLSSSKHTINLAYGISHLPFWELPGHLFPGRITSFRSWCCFFPSATLAVWLTKERTVLVKLAASQKFRHLQGTLHFHYYSFPLQMLLFDICCSPQMQFSVQGLGQHKPFSLAVWRKMLECLLQKNKHWLTLGNVTCAMRCFARPPWLHCLTLISHINIWILDDNSWRLIPESYSCLEVQISKQKHVG